MRTLALIVATLALAGCASRESIDAYAAQECARMEQHGAAAYDACVVQVVQRCEQANADAVNITGCRPRAGSS